MLEITNCFFSNYDSLLTDTLFAAFGCEERKNFIHHEKTRMNWDRISMLQQETNSEISYDVDHVC